VKRKIIICLIVLLAGSLCLMVAPVSAGIIDIGTLGGAASEARAINDSGQIVGNSQTSGGQTHAFLYVGVPGANGQMHDLGTMGRDTSSASGINQSGQIVGTATTALGMSHAFLYTGIPGAGGQMHDLGTLGGNFSYAFGINNYGEIVGYSEKTDIYDAFLYTGVPGAGGKMTSIGYMYIALDINDSGQIAGTNNWYYASIYSGGVWTDLSSSVGWLGGWVQGRYTAINDYGQLAGYYRDSNDYFHAFLSSKGSITNLGTLGGNKSLALDINNRGQIVGYSKNVADNYHAFLYNPIWSPAVVSLLLFE
jgi:probable HAF family extracellular repeat protein